MVEVEAKARLASDMMRSGLTRDEANTVIDIAAHANGEAQRVMIRCIKAAPEHLQAFAGALLTHLMLASMQRADAGIRDIVEKGVI